MELECRLYLGLDRGKVAVQGGRIAGHDQVLDALTGCAHGVSKGTCAAATSLVRSGGLQSGEPVLDACHAGGGNLPTTRDRLR